MFAALYARFSSDKQREASIEDQSRTCEEYAKRHNWKIVARYADKAMSGAVADRDQYQQMLADAEARKFDVLLVNDLSRLSRDQSETLKTCSLLEYWSVRLIGVTDGIDTGVEGHELTTGIRGAVNHDFLRKLAKETHRGLKGQALAGNHTGGKTYGYRHVPQLHPTEKDNYGRPEIAAVRREIDPAQATIVRQIFSWYATGYSANWMAGELNRLNIPGPAATWKRKTPATLWSVSTIRGDHRKGTGILNNPLYRGTVIWNRRKWITNPVTHQIVSRQRPEKEWIVKDQPALTIISPDLWEKVQARQRERRVGQVHRGRGPKYLLSSLLKCGTCGSNFVLIDDYRYGCASRTNRGKTTCANALRVARQLVEEKVLGGLRDDLITPQAFMLFKKETTRLLREHQRQQRPARDRVPKRLVAVEQEIKNISAAIKAGIITETTKADLLAAEAERATLTKQMNGRQTAEITLLATLPQAEQRYRKLIENIATFPAQHVEVARQQIKELIGEVNLRPTAKGYLEAEMRGNYAGLLKLAVGAQINMAGGPGFEPG